MAAHFGSSLFILTDDRSFRLEKGFKDRYAHWGKEQEVWILDLVKQNSGPTFLFNGSQVFPQMYFKDSMSGDHPVQFNAVINELKNFSSKVIFASGDVHFSEISQIEKEVLGYPTFELTSSSIHSPCAPGVLHLIPNPRRIVGASDRNYLIVKSTADGYGCKFTVTSHGSKGQVLFQKHLVV